MTRRGWLLASPLAITAGCGSKGETAYSGYALIATSGDKSLAAVDLSRFETLSPIALDSEPTAVLPGGPGGHVFVLTPKTGSVHVISPALKRVGGRRLSDQLTAIRITPDGKRLLAISATTKELIETDPTTLRITRRHRLSAQPAYLDVWGSYAAISAGDAGVVEMVHLESGEQWRSHLGGAAGSAKFRRDGKILLVANLSQRELTALSVPGLDTVAKLPLAMEPQNLCSNSDGGQFFVSGEGMDGVAIVFPYRVIEVDQTVLAGRDPGVMATSANPDLLFVGSHTGSDVCILNIETRKVVAIVDVGQRPTYITVTPDNQFALILDESSNDMAVIRIPTIRLNPAIVISKSGASLFTMLPVGEKPVHAAVIRKPV